MGNEGPKKGLREELGNGYLSLLDSVRHSFEQAAWGQEGSGSLTDDFYRWASPPEATPQPVQLAGPGGGIEVMPMEGRPSNLEEREAEATAYARHREAGPNGTLEMDNAHDYEWREFEAWIDGRQDAYDERDLADERGKSGPELGE